MTNLDIIQAFSAADILCANDDMAAQINNLSIQELKDLILIWKGKRDDPSVKSMVELCLEDYLHEKEKIFLVAKFKPFISQFTKEEKELVKKHISGWAFGFFGKLL